MEENVTLILGLYAAGLAAAGLLYAYRLGRAGEKRLCALLAVIFGVPLAYAGAKMFFLLHNAGMDIRNWSAETVFSLRWDEFSFTGGCLGFVLGVRIAAAVLRVNGKKALDLFAVPGCLLIVFARMAEAGMESVGQGDMPAFLPEFFPFALKDEWSGEAVLAVFTLEALAALLCAVWLEVSGRKQPVREKQFEKACLVLCSIQLFLEMTVNDSIPFIISFIHLEQVLCAVILLVLIARLTVRTKKAGPAVLAVLMIGLNALTQFVQDKPYLFPIPENADIGTAAMIAFALTSAGLIAAGLRAEGNDQKKELSLSSKGS